MGATYITKEGLAKIEKTLKELKEQKRRLSEEVGRAREHGDLRENAEYHAAKERLQQVIHKINELELKLTHVEVVDPTQLQKDTAVLGAKVTVKDMKSSKEETYTLVSADESDPASGKISVLSPMGKAFLGHKVKEKVTVNLPGGTYSYQIIAIQSAE
ncbi:MAG: transcription elongation factor GreA [Candidatus Omnitrophica bacterium]|nr:transcription elongation factor GreA [Candidatus Omnitrophota bacterium]